jgi:IS30 family transposase
VAVFFAAPHSPWQGGSHENTNGVLRQYLLKSTDLVARTQDDPGTITWQLNNRPRKLHGFCTPLQAYHELLKKAQRNEAIHHLTPVALGT